MQTKTAKCSCNVSAPHVVATRKSFDGVTVLFYNDGAITDRMGNGLRPSKKRAATLWATVDNACIMTWPELIGKV